MSSFGIPIRHYYSSYFNQIFGYCISASLQRVSLDCKKSLVEYGAIKSCDREMNLRHLEFKHLVFCCKADLKVIACVHFVSIPELLFLNSLIYRAKEVKQYLKRHSPHTIWLIFSELIKRTMEETDFMKYISHDLFSTSFLLPTQTSAQPTFLCTTHSVKNAHTWPVCFSHTHIKAYESIYTQNEILIWSGLLPH